MGLTLEAPLSLLATGDLPARLVVVVELGPEMSPLLAKIVQGGTGEQAAASETGAVVGGIPDKDTSLVSDKSIDLPVVNPDKFSGAQFDPDKFSGAQFDPDKLSVSDATTWAISGGPEVPVSAVSMEDVGSIDRPVIGEVVGGVLYAEASSLRDREGGLLRSRSIFERDSASLLDSLGWMDGCKWELFYYV